MIDKTVKIINRKSINFGHKGLVIGVSNDLVLIKFNNGWCSWVNVNDIAVTGN